jgi:hypothetical protein
MTVMEGAEPKLLGRCDKYESCAINAPKFLDRLRSAGKIRTPVTDPKPPPDPVKSMRDGDAAFPPSKIPNARPFNNSWTKLASGKKRHQMRTTPGAIADLRNIMR